MLRIDRFIYLLAALVLLMLPLNWLFAAIAAAVFHELCHICLIHLTGGRILGGKLGIGGASIETLHMSPGQELLCAAAGPMGSILLIFLCRWFPRVAICAAAQAAYNLLPIYPLDGGRMLRCGMTLLFSERLAEGICKWAEYIALAGIAVLGLVAAFFWHLGVFPLLLAAIPVMKKNFLQSDAIRGTMNVTFVTR